MTDDQAVARAVEQIWRGTGGRIDVLSAYKTDLHVKEIRAGAAGRSDSPYAALLAAYRRQMAGLRRDDLDALLDVIYRAATFPHPKLRWPVGPTSITAGRSRAPCPDRLYEWLMRIAFRIRALRL